MASKQPVNKPVGNFGRRVKSLLRHPKKTRQEDVQVTPRLVEQTDEIHVPPVEEKNQLDNQGSTEIEDQGSDIESYDGSSSSESDGDQESSCTPVILRTVAVIPVKGFRRQENLVGEEDSTKTSSTSSSSNQVQEVDDYQPGQNQDDDANNLPLDDSISMLTFETSKSGKENGMCDPVQLNRRTEISKQDRLDPIKEEKDQNGAPHRDGNGACLSSEGVPTGRAILDSRGRSLESKITLGGFTTTSVGTPIISNSPEKKNREQVLTDDDETSVDGITSNTQNEQCSRKRLVDLPSNHEIDVQSNAVAKQTAQMRRINNSFVATVVNVMHNLGDYHDDTSEAQTIASKSLTLTEEEEKTVTHNTESFARFFFECGAKCQAAKLFQDHCDAPTQEGTTREWTLEGHDLRTVDESGSSASRTDNADCIAATSKPGGIPGDQDREGLHLELFSPIHAESLPESPEDKSKETHQKVDAELNENRSISAKEILQNLKELRQARSDGATLQKETSPIIEPPSATSTPERTENGSLSPRRRFPFFRDLRATNPGTPISPQKSENESLDRKRALFGFILKKKRDTAANGPNTKHGTGESKSQSLETRSAVGAEKDNVTRAFASYIRNKESSSSQPTQPTTAELNPPNSNEKDTASPLLKLTPASRLTKSRSEEANKYPVAMRSARARSALTKSTDSGLVEKQARITIVSQTPSSNTSGEKKSVANYCGSAETAFAPATSKQVSKKGLKDQRFKNSPPSRREGKQRSAHLSRTPLILERLHSSKPHLLGQHRKEERLSFLLEDEQGICLKTSSWYDEESTIHSYSSPAIDTITLLKKHKSIPEVTVPTSPVSLYGKGFAEFEKF